ncbi:phosphatase 2C family protein [Thalictrum thalictroides]|uniref:Phosphatase 2C family protein n=1 Tax=Thalictrum thalictroides TaxID=46969 RepID=A0A7J6WCS5_THATH|nr:phosphatase 2C family protein [Thalictrum thalictroides]
MLGALMRLFSLCWKPFGVKVNSGSSSNTSFGKEGREGLLWFHDIGRYASGEFSMAIIQANQVIEDQCQIESGSFGTFLGIYDGHGGPDAARYMKQSRYSCHLCPFEEMDLKQMRKHNAIEHWDCHFLCAECVNVFKTEQHLAEHGRSEHGAVDIDPCVYCDHCEEPRKFLFPKALWEHTCRCHGAFNYLCSVCQNKYKTLRNSRFTKVAARDAADLIMELSGERILLK